MFKERVAYSPSETSGGASETPEQAPIDPAREAPRPSDTKSELVAKIAALQAQLDAQEKEHEQILADLKAPAGLEGISQAKVIATILYMSQILREKFPWHSTLPQTLADLKDG